MSILTVSVLGITAVLLAVQLKGKGGEYGTYIVMAAGLCLFFYAAGKLEVILKTLRTMESRCRIPSSEVFSESLRTMESCIGISPVYLSALLKMAGITYIAEFASGICKDAGYGSLGTQIEIFAKLSILAVSMPILLALLETVKQFLA